MKRHPLFLLLPALALLLPLLDGCGRNVTVGLKGEMATPYHIQYDATVDRKPPAIYVRPNVSPNAAPTALFVPLRITQNITRFQALSRNVSRQIWQVWLSQNAFSTLEYDDAVIPYRVADALPLARAKGAQLLVGGYIQHYLDGGSVGNSSLSLNIEVYEVATGTLLWSISQGGNFEKKQTADFFLVDAQARMPEDPMGILVRTLAHDMGLEILYWVHPDARSKGIQWRPKAF